MKKVLFWLLFIAAIVSIGYFVGYPLYLEYCTPAPVAEEITPLEDVATAQESFAQEGWVKIEKFVYQKRDLPSLEADFQAVGYPAFLYMAEDDGSLNKKGEKSFHEDGMALYLYMNDAYYLDSATMEYSVPVSRFNSTSMDANIPPFYDFVRIITGRELTDEDKDSLMRTFTDVFNETESVVHTVTINDLTFTITLDKFFNLLIISC